MRDIGRWIVFNALATVVLLLIILGIAGVGWYSNRQRIADIQQSRVTSCEKTYGAFLDVFRPFFPRERTDWTPEQARNWGRLATVVDTLVARCHQQTRPK